MGHVTVQHYAAGMVGFSLLRHWYRDADVNDDRLDALRGFLANGDEFPLDIALDPQEQDLTSGYAE